MNRRDTIATLIALGAAMPITSFAQQARKVHRIGALSTAIKNHPFPQAFPAALRRFGHDEGRNLAIEWRLSEGQNERLAAFAQDLVHLNPEVIVAHNNPSIAAIKQASAAIPVVMHTAVLPVEFGFVESLARPGGNITGTVWFDTGQAPKWLEILREAAPRTRRVAATWNPTFPFADKVQSGIESAAQLLQMKLQSYAITRPEEIEPTLDKIAASRPDALAIGSDPMMFARAREIAGLVMKHGLISISNANVFPENGTLLSYGPNLSAITDRTASFVDRILRGAKPADLPVELPAKFELVFNGKTARAIGYKIPQSLLLRADRIIE